jgi:hypothetical protein
MVDDKKAEAWEREAREILVESLHTNDRACRLSGIILTLLHDGQTLLNHISRSQAN